MSVLSSAGGPTNSKCINCGADLTPTVKFCSECGAAQTSQPVNETPASVPIEELALLPEVTAQTSDNVSLHQPPQSRSVASYRLGWLGIAVVIVALVALGSWAWVSKHPITAEHGNGNAQTRLDEIPIPQSLSPETISKIAELPNDFSHGGWTQILYLPEVSKAAERLFGSQLLYFRKMGIGSAGIADGLLVAQGCIPHDCPNGGILTIDVKTGATAGGLVDESGVTVYTGDYTRASLPAALKQWLENNNNLSVRYQDAQLRVSRGSSTPDTQAKELISNDSHFAQCRVRELEFHRMTKCSASGFAFYCDNMSRTSEDHSLKLLSDAGYIGGAGHLITTDHSTHTYYWTPNDRGRAAIGTDITERKIAEWTNGEVAYSWKLNLGCREFEQVDGTTQLGDGLKVDFSWHWKVTPLGTADRLAADRKRAVAYFTRTPSGLAVQEIQFAHEQ